jgi:peptidoglycan hydrolase CwlO-like protein
MQLWAMSPITTGVGVIPADSEFSAADHGMDADEVARLIALGVACEPDKRIAASADVSSVVLLQIDRDSLASQLGEVTAAKDAFKQRNDELLAQLGTANEALAAAHAEIAALTTKVAELSKKK